MLVALAMNIDYKPYIAKGLDYATYLQAFEKAIDENTGQPEEKQVKSFKYYALNMQRSKRIYEHLELTAEVYEALNTLQGTLHWLIITEPWCGDSAQNLPIIAKVADVSNGKIQLHIVYRDENLELMDAFLTNGGRSIPKLIQLDKDLHLLSTWGPRPQTAQALVMQLKGANIPHDEYIATVHKWYAENKGRDTLGEIVQLIKQA